jgi:hypothetical protein
MEELPVKTIGWRGGGLVASIASKFWSSLAHLLPSGMGAIEK